MTDDLYVHINTNEALVAAIKHGFTQDAVGLDTEFIHRRTYYPRPALYQLRVAEQCYLIDPLRITDMTPFKELLEATEVVKVLHGCQSDLELFADHMQACPVSLFDTQVAASFTGFGHLVSYKKLLFNALDVELEKSATMSDWLQRPLSDEQLQYAAEDVLYLEPLRQLLTSQLQALGRTEWFEEEMARLCRFSEERRYSHNNYRQHKSARKFRDIRLLYFKLLYQWREDTAQHQNQPRQWIISDKLLFRLIGEPQALRDYPNRIQKRYGNAIKRALVEADKTAKEDWPTPMLRGLRTSEIKLLENLKDQVKKKSEVLDIQANFLANNRTLSELIVTRLDGLELPVEFRGWRYQALGKPFFEQSLDGPYDSA